MKEIDAAIEALEFVEWYGPGSCWIVDAERVEAALAGLRSLKEQEPVAWLWSSAKVAALQKAADNAQQRIAELESANEAAYSAGMVEGERMCTERIAELEAQNAQLLEALTGYHSNSVKQDWPEDVWLAADAAIAKIKEVLA